MLSASKTPLLTEPNGIDVHPLTRSSVPISSIIRPRTAKSWKRDSDLYKTGYTGDIRMAESLTQAPESACPSSPPSRAPHTSAPPTTGAAPISFFLKPDDLKSERNLTSIANAGLHITPTSLSEKSRFLLSPSSMSSNNNADRRMGSQQQDQISSHHVNTSNPQAARDASNATTMSAVHERTNRSEEASATTTATTSSGDTATQAINSTSRSIPFADEPRAEELRDRRTSPASVPDQFGNGASCNSSTLINNSTVASPGPIEENHPVEDKSHRRDEDTILEDGGNKAFSYPAPMPAVTNLNDPRRGMSLPHSGLNKGGARFQSSKKHRCPYCATEFTRHHNLKSHLLTHSQEKPYVCQTCQSRFRRLHDLKRHTKLHTGERPHICPKCARRFARGDALARHNKGPGGCAGRRSSMGSFGADEKFGDGGGGGDVAADDTMEGLIYTTEPDRMDEEDEHRLNLPAPKKDASPPEPHSQSGAGRHVSFQQSHQPSTYPPLATSRPSQGGLFPPVTSHPGSGSSASSGTHLSFPVSGSSGSSTFNPGQPASSPSMFPQAGMTESPKPLSPNALSSRQLGHGPEGNIRTPSSHPPLHSPNLKPQFQPHQHQHMSRNSQGPGTGLGIPFTNASSSSLSVQNTLSLPGSQSGTPHLPPPPGLNPPDSRYTLHSQGISQSSSGSMHQTNSNHPGPGYAQHHHTHTNSSTESNNNNNSSNNATNPLHGDNININNPSNIFPPHQQKSDQPQRQLSIPSPNPNLPSNDRIWGYMRALEDRVNGLESEVIRLRDQLGAERNQRDSNKGGPSTSSAPSAGLISTPSTNGNGNGP